MEECPKKRGMLLRTIKREEKEKMKLVVNENILLFSKGDVKEKGTLYSILTRPLSERV